MNKIEQLTSVDGLIILTIHKLYRNVRVDFEDLLQDARMVVFDCLDNYDETKSKLSTFVTLVLNTTFRVKISRKYNYLSKEDNKEFEFEKNADNSKDNSYKYLYKNLEDIVVNHSNEFSKSELQFLLLILDKNTPSQIMEIMNITSNNLRVICNHCKNKIKEILL